MPATKSLVAGGAFATAALTADAFVSTGAPSQHGAPSALQGTTQKLGQSTLNQFDAYPTAIVAAAGVAVVGIFAGSGRHKTRDHKRATGIVCNFSKQAQLGAQDPLGFWDPLDLCKDEAAFKDYRAKEIKHGRLAMMGALGMLTQSLVQLPGMEGVPKDVSACLVGNGQVGFLATLAIIAGLEVAVFVQDPKKEPGNFGNPLPWFDDYSDEMRARELNNGRIAMFAALGQISAGLYTGKSAMEQFGLSALPRQHGVAVAGSFVGFAGRKPDDRNRAAGIARNFNKQAQLGAQDPLGFWDPLDLCKDQAAFKDYRAKEIKHGRLAMMGALGMLTQSLVQLPGMEGVPKDVSACLVGNGQVGFLATLAIIAGLEVAVFVQDPKKEPSPLLLPQLIMGTLRRGYPRVLARADLLLTLACPAHVSCAWLAPTLLTHG
jgi:hypothetical protein